LADVKLSAASLRGINRYRERHGLSPLDSHGRPVSPEAIQAQEARRLELARKQREIDEWWRARQ
jgi:hypothetical protein